MKETDQVSDQTQESSASTERTNEIEKSNPIEDYKKDMFKFKSKARELEDKLKEYELREQEQKGNLQEVIAKLKDENRSLKQSVTQSQVSFAEGKIEDTIKLLAKDAGCQDVNTFYRLIDKTDIDMIELDDKFRANEVDVKDLVEKYKKNYEHLGFFKQNVNIVDKAPNSKPINPPKKEKALEDMTMQELLAVAESKGLKRLK
jgi:hypothetical protein